MESERLSLSQRSSRVPDSSKGQHPVGRCKPVHTCSTCSAYSLVTRRAATSSPAAGFTPRAAGPCRAVGTRIHANVGLQAPQPMHSPHLRAAHHAVQVLVVVFVEARDGALVADPQVHGLRSVRVAKISAPVDWPGGVCAAVPRSHVGRPQLCSCARARSAGGASWLLCLWLASVHAAGFSVAACGPTTAASLPQAGRRRPANKRGRRALTPAHSPAHRHVILQNSTRVLQHSRVAEAAWLASGAQPRPKVVTSLSRSAISYTAGGSGTTSTAGDGSRCGL